MPNLDMPTRLLIPGDSLIYDAINYLGVSVDLSSATWNTAAKHEVFTVTGSVRLRFLILCTETLADAGDTAQIKFGHEDDTAAFILATNAAGAGGETITANTMWIDASPGDVTAAFGSAVLDYVLTGGRDVGYEITGEALTDGTLVFHCWWEDLDGFGDVVAGAGGVL